jgi:hypothetical protein
MIIRICLTLLLVLVTSSTLAEAQQRVTAFVNVNVIPFDREPGLTPYQAIEAATRNPAEYFAEFMKTKRDFGTVETGLRADLILLDANPLQSVTNLSKRTGVMVRGRWLPETELRKMLENVAALNRAVASAQAGFGGTWTLDKANSEGLPPGMDQLMTVTLSGDKLSVETKLITEQGEQVVPDSYILDGKEAEFTPKGLGGQTGKGVRTAKWGTDRNSFEVSEKATFDTPEGALNVQATRQWVLSPDGKTLKIDMTVDGPNGKQLIKRTFIRK